MLKCYIEYSTVVSKYTGYEPSEFITEMLNCMPIFSVDGASVVKMNGDDLIEHFNRILTDYFESVGNRVLIIDDISDQFTGFTTKNSKCSSTTS